MIDRQRIVDVAITLFKEKDYDSVTVDEICKKAGIAYSTFFYQFKTKGNLLLEYGKETVAACRNPAQALLEESPLDKFMYLLKAYLEAHARLGKPLLKKFLLLGAENEEHWMSNNALMQESTDITHELLDAARAKGEILSDESSNSLCQIGSAMSFSLIYTWALDPEDDDLVSYFLKYEEIMLQVAPHKRRYAK